MSTVAVHDDARNHRDRAEQSRRDAELAEERAKVEAELDDQRAASREEELGERR